MIFLQELKFRNELLFYFGFTCLLAALACFTLVWIKPIALAGTNAWYKPFKFFLSTTIFVWSMGWYAWHLKSDAMVQSYSWGMIILFTLENFYILLQAARGLPSHFNTSSPLYASLWRVMALAALGISVWTAVLGLSFFTNAFPELPASYLWGIRIGLLIFFIFSVEGLAMGARMAHTVGASDGGAGLPLVNWSTRHGDLRIAHFLGMHALQLLPLLAFYWIKNPKGIIIVGTLYAIVVVAVFIQALQGKPLLRL